MIDVFFVSGVRTAVGTFGGSLKDVPPTVLGTHVAGAAIARSGLEPAQIENAVFGQVIQTEPQDAYLARVAAVKAGVPFETPALTVNRLCGSGLQAIVSAAQSIMLGDCATALAGGAEVMSRSPSILPSFRFGRAMGDDKVVDGLTGALTDPFNRIHMGVTAENVAERYGISREAQDAWALTSHRRAAAAIAEGRFKEQIVPVQVGQGRRAAMFDTDEHVRADVSLERLGALKPVFKEDGRVTAGNASGINDGAAAVVLAGGEAVAREGLRPMARLVSYGHAGVDPAYMGIGPVAAVRQALARAGLSVGDVDVIESNEAFAAQVCAVSAELGFDEEKVNPNGSGIALGHPVGATGAIIAVKAIHELHRVNGRYALITMCIGGGQGIAAIIERA